MFLYVDHRSIDATLARSYRRDNAKNAPAFWLATEGTYAMNGQAIVSEQLAAKFKAEKETPYTRFIVSEGLDLINGTMCHPYMRWS